MLRVAPCLPSPTDCPPSGPGWLHEIKHDGFRLLAQRSGGRVQLYTRIGYNLTTRYPLIARAVELLALRSCLIDGEVIVCDGNGLADFELLRGRQHDGDATLCAFDLLELNGRDLRQEPIEDRKRELTDLLRDCGPGLVINKVFIEPGDVVFKHACALGCEGIVSKRRGSRYRSGRSPDWLKLKNPEAPAVKREAEIDWSRERWRRR